jgi:hypothetical protein
LAENRKGVRCTRRPTPEGVLCAIHERTHSTPEMYERETERFLRDVYAAGRRANRDVLLAFLVMAFDDDDIRQEFLSGVESAAGEMRLAKSASEVQPHPARQNQKRETQPQGGHQAQTPDPPPPPPPAPDDDDVIFIDGEEIEQ